MPSRIQSSNGLPMASPALSASVISSGKRVL